MCYKMLKFNWPLGNPGPLIGNKRRSNNTARQTWGFPGASFVSLSFMPLSQNSLTRMQQFLSTYVYYAGAQCEGASDENVATDRVS